MRRRLAHLARRLDWQARYSSTHAAPDGMSPADIVPHLLWPIGGRRSPRLLHAATVFCILLAAVLIEFGPCHRGILVFVLKLYVYWNGGYATALALCLAGSGYVIFRVSARWPTPIIGSRAKSSVRGLFGRLGFGLVSGFVVYKAGLRYVFGVACAAARGRLPWRPAAFCRWACDAGLLRVAGATYQFRHDELRRWLTDPDRSHP